MRTDEEKEKLGEPSGKTNKPQPVLNNRDLQQAILDTFGMLRQTEPNDYDLLRKHLNTLLNLQLIRTRGGYVDK